MKTASKASVKRSETNDKRIKTMMSAELVETYGANHAQNPIMGFVQQFLIDWHKNPNAIFPAADGSPSEGWHQALSNWPVDRRDRWDDAQRSAYDRLMQELGCTMAARLARMDAAYFRDIAWALENLFEFNGAVKVRDPLAKRLRVWMLLNPGKMISPRRMQEWLGIYFQYAASDLKHLAIKMRKVGVPIDSSSGRPRNRK